MYCGGRTRETFCLLNEMAAQEQRNSRLTYCFNHVGLQGATHTRSASKGRFSAVCPVPGPKHVGLYYYVRRT